MNPKPSAVFRELVKAPKFQQLIDEIVRPIGSNRPQSDNIRELIELTALLAVQMCTPPAPPPAPFPTDKLEFWEQCFLASIRGGYDATTADYKATQALLHRNNLIALLGEKPNDA